MKKDKLTVVTTTYNQVKFIEECINGVINQKTNFVFKYIISDDGSTDGTRDIIKKYAKKYPQIIKPIFREKNLGPMDNFISTLNEAGTEYVALCDGDDFWTDQNKLQQQVDFLEKHKDFNICFHQTKRFYDDNSKEATLYPQSMKDVLAFDDLLGENFITANTVVYRWKFRKKDSFKKMFPKDIIPGDYYVHLVHAKDGKIKYINKQMSCYRIQKDGMWYGTTKPKLMYKFYQKNGLKMINFYSEAQKNFNIVDDRFEYVKKYMIICTFNASIFLRDKKLFNTLFDKYFTQYSGDLIGSNSQLNLISKIKLRLMLRQKQKQSV